MTAERALGRVVLWSRWDSLGLRAEYGAVAAAAIAYAALLGCYVASSAFKDHVEPSVGAVAAALLRGQAPYHGTTGLESYELPYGPAVFGLHALAFGVFGRSIATLKLSGLVACAGAVALTFAVLRRRASLRCASGGLLLLLLYLAYYDARAYWCRPEPFLLLGSASALWLVRAHPRWSALGCSVLVAWTFDLKATGPLYLAPIFVLVAVDRGWREAMLAAAAGGVMGLVVFAIPPFSLPAYVALLAKTARHGLSGHELVLNVTAAAVLFGPVLLVRALRVKGSPVPPQRPSWRVPTGTLVACVALVCVVAAKPGAGRHHLVPFVPLAMDAFIDGVDGIARDRLAVRLARALTLLVRAVFCVVVILLARAHVEELDARAARAGEAATELRSLLSAYAGGDLQMGYGDAASYDDSSGRLLVAFARPLRLDAASLMDSTAAGYPATCMLAGAMASCRPRVWIVPRGEPFSMPSFYGAARLFDAPFRDAFAQQYELVETRTVYRVYRCKGAR